MVPQSIQGAPENAPNNAPNAPNGLSIRILAEISRNNSITYSELAGKLEVHRKTIMRKIKTLKEFGNLVRVGDNKTGSGLFYCSGLSPG